MNTFIVIAPLVLSLVLIGLVLLQERSSGAGGLFGGTEGGSYQTRRGLERIIFWATIVIAVLFAALAVVSLALPKF